MAEKKTITLEVVVDDKGAASVKILTDSIDKLNKTQKKSNETTKSAQTENGRLAAQIEKLANSKRRTIEVIQQEIKLRKQLIQRVATTNEGYLKGTMQVMRLEKELKDLTKTQSTFNASSKLNAKNMGSVRSATGNATGMMVELGRTISDANYGITGMANNLQQLASTFILSTKSSGGFKGAIKDLGKSFMGVGGILVIISTVITLFERYAMKQREAKDNTDELNKSIARETSSLNTLLSFAKAETLNKETREKAINKINKEYPEYLSNLSLENIGTDKLNKLIERQIELEIARAKAKAIADEIAKENIKLLDTEAKSATESLNFIQGTFAATSSFLARKFGVDISTISEKAIVAAKENNQAAVQDSKVRIERLINDLKEILKDTPNAIDAIVGDDDSKKDAIDKLESFLDEIRQKRKEADAKTEMELLSVKEQAAIEEATALGANEAQLNEIRAYYGVLAFDLLKEQHKEKMDEIKKQNEEEYKEAVQLAKRKERAELRLSRRKKQIANDAIDAVQGAFDKETAIAKAAFIAKQVMSVQETILEAKKTITFTKLGLARSKAAVAEGSAQTAKVGFPQNIPLLALYAVQAASILSSIKSAFKTSEDAASGLGGGSVGGGDVAPPAAPDFNIVGASPTSQLAETIATAEQQPIKAFVVSEEVTTAQQLDRNIINGASLG